MVELPLDADKYRRPPASAIVEATLNLMRDLVRRRCEGAAEPWPALVTGALVTSISRDDIAELETKILASGHRFDWSAVISVEERPLAYKGRGEEADLAAFSFQHPDAPAPSDDGQGRELRGVGDNVVRHAVTALGTARYIRDNQRVLAYLTEGVPPGTIAVIDDSGGTLTAPIIDQFAGIICAGGTVRSHLGILAREYGIPCLMNAKLSGIHDGDVVEIEATAPAKSAEDYQQGVERVARIWRKTG